MEMSVGELLGWVTTFLDATGLKTVLFTMLIISITASYVRYFYDRS